MNFSNWSKFDIVDFFDVTGSKTTPLTKLKNKGLYPYVTTKASNNGVGGYFDIFTEKGNVLCVDSAVGGWMTYQPDNFSASDHVEKLIPKFELNKFIALFICTVWNKTLAYRKYSYGVKANQSMLRRQEIYLPSKDGSPDWEFMSEYMKNIYLKTSEKYKSNIKKQKLDFRFESWHEFVFGNIVTIKATSSGIDKIALVTGEEGKYPYVTRSEGKPNGIDSYICKQIKPLDKGNQISLGLDTQTIFYQAEDFYTGQNIQIISYDGINKFNAMFLISVLRKTIKEKFSWGGNGATLSRLKAMIVALPAKKVNGVFEPDWEFMSEYIQKLPYSDKI